MFTSLRKKNPQPLEVNEAMQLMNNVRFNCPSSCVVFTAV